MRVDVRWHITGDSFVEGVGATGNQGWAQQAANKLAPETVSINGIGGATSADLVTRLPEELLSKPENLVVSIGINDSRYRPSLGANEVSLADFRCNIEHLIEISRQAGVATIFLIGLTRVDASREASLKPDKLYRSETIAEYDASIRDLAARHQRVVYIPVPPLNDTADQLADGLHPSDMGHRTLFDAVVPELQKCSDAGGLP